MTSIDAAATISRALAAAKADAARHDVASRTAAAQARRLRAALEPAIWTAYHDEGLSAPQIAARLTGISHDSVTRIVGSRTHPKPRPNV